MELTPDTVIVFEWGSFKLNATIMYTWVVMALLVGVSMLVTRHLRPDVPPSRWRNILEIIVKLIEGQVAEVSHRAVRPVTYFAGTLFLFIALSNLLLIIPGFRPPTGSLSTTVALTLAVLVAVPLFSICDAGVRHYMKQFVEPTAWLLPFNILSEFSKAVSLSIRLYGNVMSGAVIVAILLSVAPFFFPVVMQMLGLITGMIQAYIFAVLAAVYISSAMADKQTTLNKGKSHE